MTYYEFEYDPMTYVRTTVLRRITRVPVKLRWHQIIMVRVRLAYLSWRYYILTYYLFFLTHGDTRQRPGQPRAGGRAAA